MKNNKHETTLKEALDQFLDYYKLRGGFNEKQINKYWEEIVGKAVFEHTRKIELKEKKLFVKTDSSVVRQELLFMKSRIKQVINRKMNKDVVEEIIVM